MAKNFSNWSTISTNFGQQVRRFYKSESGVSAIEFALVVPFLMVVFLGFSEVALANRTSTHVSKVAATVADIISQSASISIEEVEIALRAAHALAGASAAGTMTVEVVGVNVASNGSTSVVWARGVNSTNLPAPGNSYDLPDDLKTEAGFIVASRANYKHLPIIGGSMVGTVEMEKKFYFIPRSGTMTQCSGC